MCAPGFGGPLCTPCALNQWSAGGNATLQRPDCVACPSGKFTATTGSDNSSDCVGEIDEL